MRHSFLVLMILSFLLSSADSTFGQVTIRDSLSIAAGEQAQSNLASGTPFLLLLLHSRVTVTVVDFQCSDEQNTRLWINVNGQYPSGVLQGSINFFKNFTETIVGATKTSSVWSPDTRVFVHSVTAGRYVWDVYRWVWRTEGGVIDGYEMLDCFTT